MRICFEFWALWLIRRLTRASGERPVPRLLTTEGTVNAMDVQIPFNTTPKKQSHAGMSVKKVLIACSLNHCLKSSLASSGSCTSLSIMAKICNISTISNRFIVAAILIAGPKGNALLLPWRHNQQVSRLVTCSLAVSRASHP